MALSASRVTKANRCLGTGVPPAPSQLVPQPVIYDTQDGAKGVKEWTSPCPVCGYEVALEEEYLPDEEFPDLQTRVRYVCVAHERPLSHHPYIAHE